MDRTAKGFARRYVAVGIAVGLLLAATVGTPGAGAHPGREDPQSGGIGVQVNSPDGLSGFRTASQWDGTAPVADQTADLVYAGTGCTPASYVTAGVEGMIALIDAVEGQGGLLDPCPLATFKQKMEGAELAGAIGLVQVSDTDQLAPANAIASGIPGLELTNSDGAPLRDAVLDGTTVNVTLTSTHDPVDLSERLSNVACADGRADVFECDGVDLLSFVPLAEFQGDLSLLQIDRAGASDLWGWTDPEHGDEYVLIGKTNGVGIFRVTDPTDPVYLGAIPNRALLHRIWHDIKVYDNHAFIVSESEPHGMKVFDLTRLRGVNEPREWREDGFYPLHSAAHNIEVNTDTGYAYIVGGNAGLVVPDHCLSGLHMVDISTPTLPTFAGCYAEEGGPGTLGRTLGEPVQGLSPAAYVHDTQCVLYDGPDSRYTGRELCFNSAEDKVVIVDVTDKLAPVTVGMTDYPNVGYTHQGWLTEDQSYLIVNDELDEITHERIAHTRTVVLDVTDLESPTLHVEHFHDTESITHNNYVHGDLVYQSNYTSGLRVLDTTPLHDAANPRLEEVAFFDTFPAHGDPTFEGTWSNYPFFESGTIAVSGIEEGLFLLRLQDGVGDPEDPLVEVACTNCPLEVRAGESGVAQVTVGNAGAAAATYAITLGELPERWSAAVDPQEVAVAPGETAQVAVTVAMPRRAPAGTSTLTVTATSTADPDVTGAAPVEVEVRKGQPSDPGPTQAAGTSGPHAPTASGATGSDAALVAAVDNSGSPAAGVALALLLLVGGSTVHRYLLLRRS